MVVQLSFQSALMFFALHLDVSPAPPLAIESNIAIVQESEQAADQDQRPDVHVSSVPS
jgi:hypothetical protein